MNHPRHPIIATATLMLALVAGSIAPAGCSWFSSAATTVKADLINCASVDLGVNVTGVNLTSIKSAGESLLLTVVAILANGGTNWQGDLTALETKYSSEALACAAQIASDLFKPASTTTPGTADADQVAALQRAQAVVAAAAKGRKLSIK